MDSSNVCTKDGTVTIGLGGIRQGGKDKVGHVGPRLRLPTA